MSDGFSISKDLVAASATPIVLAILSRGESYGYEIMRTVREASDDRMNWTDGMLYPVLHRLEAAGSLTSRWRTADTGRRRKYYRITDTGRAQLHELRQQWEVVHEAMLRIGGDG